MRRILVTSALPYANGPLHLGHLVEYTQTDIWVRHQKMAGNECFYVCADDTHGTPIMLRAQSEGITPEELIARVGAEHAADFAAFGIDFDHFHSTNAPENRARTEQIFQSLDAAGHIARRTIRQAYDAKAGMFLPDRYVKGTCPRCKAADQYGDSCEKCGATYSPSELIDPVSAVSGTTPEERDSEHLFFQLGHFEALLKDWVRSGTVDAGVANKLDEWFTAGLRDWDISRDAPYFGFGIPGAPGKFFYVWLDAPIGYIGSFDALSAKRGVDIAATHDEFWGAEGARASGTELYHFIGKDILYFHALFWPAVLNGAGMRTPNGVFVHGFLTVNGQKMSKSRGTFITARQYLDLLPAEPLRFYFASKLTSGLDDMDLSLEDFTSRFNAEVVGKVVNIGSRCAGFLTRSFEGRLASSLPEPALFAEFAAARPRIQGLYEARDYAAAVREVMALADKANQYIDTQKPWLLAKDPARAAEVHAVCTQGLNLFRSLVGFLKPVMPNLAAGAEAFLQSPISRWEQLDTPLLDHAIRAYEALATRLDAKLVAQLVVTPPTVSEPIAEAKPAQGTAESREQARSHKAGAASKESGASQDAKAAAPTAVANAGAAAGATPEIDLEALMKVELRVAEVLEASAVEGSDKLLKLRVSLGTSADGTAIDRTIFSGIRSAYAPEQLVGRQVVIVANLKPRKMRFGTSEGMVLAAENGTGGIFVLSPDAGAVTGSLIK
jgi:methionyl-tRNA synthetase